jgi:Transposase IS4
MSMPPFTAHPGPIPPAVAPDLDADLFITPEIVEMIRKQTNRRAYMELSKETPPQLLQGWKEVSIGDVYGFLSITITMGLQERPEEADFWSTDEYLGCTAVRHTMPYARFKQIKHCLMVANPTEEANARDKLAKVRPFLNAIRDIIMARYHPSQDLSLDESQCKCGHRYSRVSYRGETKKPIADYIKIISLHCAHCGYCVDFLVDTRTQTTHEMVMEVCSRLPPGQPFRIATDRFYTSVATAKALLTKGLFMYGTVRTDRGVDQAIKPNRENPLNDGEHRWSMAPPHLLSCVWRDTTKEGVWFLSTCHDGRAPAGQVRRRKRGQAAVMKSAPQVAIDYNMFMGGCDRANSLRQSYNTYLTHKKRWYMSLFYFGLDLLLVNALIYHNQRTASALTQKTFRIEVAKKFAQRARAAGAGAAATGPPRKRVRMSKEQLNSFRQRPGQHTLVHAQLPPTRTQPTCRWCYMTLVDSRGKPKCVGTSYICSVCEVGLHADCFHPFHNADI